MHKMSLSQLNVELEVAASSHHIHRDAQLLHRPPELRQRARILKLLDDGRLTRAVEDDAAVGVIADGIAVDSIGALFS
jgi:hypothetical protein